METFFEKAIDANVSVLDSLGAAWSRVEATPNGGVANVLTRNEGGESGVGYTAS